MNLKILNLSFFWILQNWFDQFWQQQKCGPFLNSNSLWTRATVFECCKRILQRWQSWPTQKKGLCQTWGWGEVACEQNKCNNNSLAPHWITLITKQMGSNPKAKQDHHMKYHQHPPWQVTSSTDKVKYMVILLGITCGVSQPPLSVAALQMGCYWYRPINSEHPYSALLLISSSARL